MRVDAALVARGLARSRGHARELVGGGHVIIEGRVATKPAAPVRPDTVIELAGDAGPARVGRAAGKLDAAFARFGPAGLSARDRRCLDVGASTGGFTQVLLEQGAAHVVALDVGHGQLVPQLAADPRVTERSGVNIRDVDPTHLTAGHGPFGLLVADLSFISLRLVLPHLAPLLAPDGDAVLLVKPQFEVGRGGLDKHGVVRTEAARRDALTGVLHAAGAIGWHARDIMDSPVRGASGNREYLGWFTPGPAPQRQPVGIEHPADARAPSRPEEDHG